MYPMTIPYFTPRGASRYLITHPVLLVALLCLTGIRPILALDDDGEQGIDANPPGASPLPQWLDEVRAQRQAREARREEARKALDARHRLIDPWGAAQHEAREREFELRRQSNRERIEQEREQFWSRRPPFPGPLPSTPIPWQPGFPTAAEPPGWDNRWYFQGY